MAHTGFQCPNCGHPVTREEDEAEALATSEPWICPQCGFEIQAPAASGLGF